MLLETEKKQETKRMAFSVENLAKSSRTDSEESGRNVKTPDIHQQLYQNVSIPYPSLQDNFSPNGQYVGRFTYSPGMSSSPGNVKNGDDSFCNLGVQSPSTTGNDSFSNTSAPSSEERKLKRKRCESEETIPSGRMSTDSLESISPYTSDCESNSSSDSNRRKKARTAFSTEQVNDLEARYQSQKYLPATERSSLAEKLGLSDQQVKTWFQNRRMKEKRQQRDEEQARSFTLPTGGVDVSQLAALGIPLPPQPIRAGKMNQITGSTANQNGISHIQGQFPGFFNPHAQQHLPVGFPPMLPVFPMYPGMSQMVPHMHPGMTLSPMGRQAK